MSPRRDKERWEKDITQRAKLLHRKITQANEIYKAEKGIPTVSEITQAFALSLLDISRYCSDNNINAREIDTVKLMAFSIPYLLSVRDYGLRLDIYSHACLVVIEGQTSPVDAKSRDKFYNTTQVMKSLCLKYPSQHMVVYGYLKGYQESLEINSPI
jgi:hypothetical protein